jgi:hypothetical protein
MKVNRETIRHIAQRIIDRLGKFVTARQVYRHFWNYRTKADATTLLESLMEHGHGHWMSRRAGPKGGRPTRVFCFSSEPFTPTLQGFGNGHARCPANNLTGRRSAPIVIHPGSADACEPAQSRKPSSAMDA